MPNPARPGARPHASAARMKLAPAKPKARRPSAAVASATTPTALVHELGSCLTEADIVQVLYRALQPQFGYDVILLQVLDREGWTRSLPIDSGVLQDVRRRQISGSTFARQYANPQTTVLPATRSQVSGRGPGTGRRVKLIIWVPVEHQGKLIGSVVYQSHRSR